MGGQGYCIIFNKAAPKRQKAQSTRTREDDDRG